MSPFPPPPLSEHLLYMAALVIIKLFSALSNALDFIPRCHLLWAEELCHLKSHQEPSHCGLPNTLEQNTAVVTVGFIKTNHNNADNILTLKSLSRSPDVAWVVGTQDPNEN